MTIFLFSLGYQTKALYFQSLENSIRITEPDEKAKEIKCNIRATGSDGNRYCGEIMLQVSISQADWQGTFKIEIDDKVKEFKRKRKSQVQVFAKKFKLF